MTRSDRCGCRRALKISPPNSRLYKNSLEKSSRLPKESGCKAVPTLRAFVGVRPGAAVAARLRGVRDDFGVGAVRWIPEENLHLTLKFLGDVEEARVGPMCAALREALAGNGAFSAAAKGLGVFPDPRRPRVLWAGLKAPELAQVVERVEGALEPFGVARAVARFRPHLTIGRWRQPETRLAGLREALARWRDREFGEFGVESVTLFRSTQRPSGAVYDPLEVFPLVS